MPLEQECRVISMTCCMQGWRGSWASRIRSLQRPSKALQLMPPDLYLSLQPSSQLHLHPALPRRNQNSKYILHQHNRQLSNNRLHLRIAQHAAQRLQASRSRAYQGARSTQQSRPQKVLILWAWAGPSWSSGGRLRLNRRTAPAMLQVKAISLIRPGNWIYQLAMHASITTAHAHT